VLINTSGAVHSSVAVVRVPPGSVEPPAAKAAVPVPAEALLNLAVAILLTSVQEVPSQDSVLAVTLGGGLGPILPPYAKPSV
jgi:hypothetical protein